MNESHSEHSYLLDQQGENIEEEQVQEVPSPVKTKAATEGVNESHSEHSYLEDSSSGMDPQQDHEKEKGDNFGEEEIAVEAVSSVEDKNERETKVAPSEPLEGADAEKAPPKENDPQNKKLDSKESSSSEVESEEQSRKIEPAVQQEQPPPIVEQQQQQTIPDVEQQQQTSPDVEQQQQTSPDVEQPQQYPSDEEQRQQIPDVEQQQQQRHKPSSGGQKQEESPAVEQQPQEISDIEKQQESPGEDQEEAKKASSAASPRFAAAYSANDDDPLHLMPCTPYEPTVLLPIICIIFAHIFFHIAAFSCRSFQAKPVPTSNPFDTAISFNFGLWDRESQNQCVGYGFFDGVTPALSVDAPLKLGRAAGILGSIIGFGFVIWACSTLYVKYSRRVLRIIVFAMAVSMSIFSCTLYVALQTDLCKWNRTDVPEFNCSVAGPGILASLSAILWAAACMAYDCVKVRPTPVLPIVQPQEELSTQEQQKQQQEEPKESPPSIQKEIPPPPPLPLPQPSTDVDEKSQVSEKKKEEEKPKDQTTVEIEIINHPDGSKTRTTTKTTKRADGNTIIIKSVDVVPSRSNSLSSVHSYQSIAESLASERARAMMHPQGFAPPVPPNVATQPNAGALPPEPDFDSEANDDLLDDGGDDDSDNFDFLAEVDRLVDFTDKNEADQNRSSDDDDPGEASSMSSF